LEELIAKPPALPETWASDALFQELPHWRTMFSGGFAITSETKIKPRQQAHPRA